MVAVGVWGAILGRPLLWALPVAFLMLVVVGDVLGIVGVPLRFVATGVAASVVVLGVAILAAWRAPVVVAIAIICGVRRLPRFCPRHRTSDQGGADFADS